MNSSDPSPRAPVRLPGHPLDWPRDAGKVELLLQDIEAKLQRKRRRRRRATSAVASALALAAVAFWAIPWVKQTQRIETQTATRQTLALADGSTVELNAHSRLQTDFRYGRRLVRLERGEAFFSVAKDLARPFVVETSLGTVRVTGTQFNVRLDSPETGDVTLVEGHVNFARPDGAAQSLEPGQQVTAEGAVRRLTDAQLLGVTAWRQGRLVLDGLTLGEAAARFADYHGRGIVVAPEVAGLRMGGSCQLDDLAGFLEFLPQALAVHVLLRGDGSFRVVAR